MVPHYAYLKLKMPSPRGVITVNGNTERSLRIEEHTAALAAEVQSGLLKKHYNPAPEPLDTIKRVRTTLQQDSVARQEPGADPDWRLPGVHIEECMPT